VPASSQRSAEEADGSGLRLEVPRKEGTSMRKIIEYSMASVDGVFTPPEILQFGQYDNYAYDSDGLGQLCACDAVLLGRTTYVQFANLWPGEIARGPTGSTPSRSMSSHRRCSMSTGRTPSLSAATSKPRSPSSSKKTAVHACLRPRTTLANADESSAVGRARSCNPPVLAGSGGALIHQQLTASMELVAAKTFSNIVKLSYEPNARKF
jgi:hypothetical protein